VLVLVELANGSHSDFLFFNFLKNEVHYFCNGKIQTCHSNCAFCGSLSFITINFTLIANLQYPLWFLEFFAFRDQYGMNILILTIDMTGIVQLAIIQAFTAH
jgi:hypothetical protein